eukprot:SAG11_NODE_3303_length_2537_cov_4.486464_1_plen_126_part_00
MGCRLGAAGSVSRWDSRLWRVRWGALLLSVLLLSALLLSALLLSALLVLRIPHARDFGGGGAAVPLPFIRLRLEPSAAVVPHPCCATSCAAAGDLGTIDFERSATRTPPNRLTNPMRIRRQNSTA